MVSYLDPTGTKHLIQKVIDTLVPVGTIWLDGGSGESPAALFGGSWERIAEGRALVGIDPDSDGMEGMSFTGGSAQIDLETVGRAGLRLESNAHMSWSYKKGANLPASDYFGVDAYITLDKSINWVNGGESYPGLPLKGKFNNYPPYYCVAAWCRVPEQ